MVLTNPTLKISVNDVEMSTTGKPLTNSNKVREVVQKFRSKYGEGNVKNYYSKFAVAVEVPL